MHPAPPSCEEVALLLSRSLDGDLSRGESAQLFAHLVQCDACRAAMGELAAIESGLLELGKQVESVSLPVNFAETIIPENGDSAVVQLRTFTRQMLGDVRMRDKLAVSADTDAFVRQFVELARQSGYALNPAQVAALFPSTAANDGELDDELLEQVAAAGSPSPGQHLLGLLGRLFDQD